ncbi:MAG: hypothetical protein EOM31_02675 [Bacteroidia bacterium]|nr:hypothetical protein [Bacteroidia bacterium]
MNRKRYNSTTIWSTLGTGVLMLTLFGACSPKGKMTKPLFMQSKSASIDIPKEEAGVVAEVVNYTNADTIAPDALSSQNPTNLDTSTVYKLNQVTIAAARIKAVPERNGLVNINFRIKVPKTLLSTNFRMKLSPQLASHDSVIKLPIVVLKGEEFLNKQKQDYAKYDAYLNSIIDTTAYDSAFLNRKQIAKDIRSRQKFNWNIYHRQWKMQMAFMAWKNRTEERYALFNTKQEGYRNGLYHEYLFQAQELKIRNNIMQKDTVGIEKRYLKKFKRKAGVLPQYWLQRDLTLKHVPRKYRKLYTSGQTLEDIVNPAMTDQDSIDIAKHRYFYGKIAENETKKRRQKEIFGKMVPYPYEETMQLDSIVTTDSDFVYYYKHVQPVLQGMKSLHLTMKGRVDAIDLSSYVLPKSDTLTYTISSLVQLVDSTLAYREV